MGFTRDVADRAVILGEDTIVEQVRFFVKNNQTKYFG